MKSIGKILLVMYGTTAILLFLLAVLVQNFQLNDSGISIGICVVYVISCFLGGFLAGKIQKTRKFLWGLLVGLIYIICMLGISLLTKQGLKVNFSGVLLNLLLCLGGGMLGGMIS